MKAVYYRVYGLTLSSEMPLPELAQVSLAESSALPDVRVQFALAAPSQTLPLDWFMTWTLPSGDIWLSCAKEERGYRLRFSAAVDFLVDTSGQEILCAADPEIANDTLRHLLLDQVLPLVLNLRGREALHAAAVVTPAGVCAFAGPGGAGKSTLTASFLTAGYSILSDDCVALEEHGARVLATPGYPGLRVWQDTRDHLGDRNVSFLPVAAYTAKQRLMPMRSEHSFPVGLQPLARIYVLQRPTESNDADAFNAPFIERLSWRDSLMALVTCAFRLDITDRAMVTRQLAFLERVAARVPVRRLHVPNTLAALPAVRAVILADVEAP